MQSTLRNGPYDKFSLILFPYINLIIYVVSLHIIQDPVYKRRRKTKFRNYQKISKMEVNTLFKVGLPKDPASKAKPQFSIIKRVSFGLVVSIMSYRCKVVSDAGSSLQHDLFICPNKVGCHGNKTTHVSLFQQDKQISFLSEKKLWHTMPWAKFNPFIG